MSGDILQTPDAPKPQGALDNYFKITARGSTVRQEVLAGLTTFLAMVYSVIVVPGMLGKAGFPPAAVFVATCLVAGFGSLLMGLWANLPMAIGCAISLTAFTAFSLVLGQQISVPVALGAVFLMGVIFTAISVTGVRTWILRNLPMGIAHGTGIGIGLFLLLIAANGVGMVIKNPIEGLPVALGAFTSFPVMMSLLGLAVIFGLEKCRVPGGILLVIIAISIIGLIFDPAVKYHGLVAMPSLTGEDGKSLIFSLDIMGALQPTVLPSVLALVMTAVFDATGTIRAVAGQAGDFTLPVTGFAAGDSAITVTCTYTYLENGVPKRIQSSTIISARSLRDAVGLVYDVEEDTVLRTTVNGVYLPCEGTGSTEGGDVTAPGFERQTGSLYLFAGNAYTDLNDFTVDLSGLTAVDSGGNALDGTRWAIYAGDVIEADDYRYRLLTVETDQPRRLYISGTVTLRRNDVTYRLTLTNYPCGANPAP